MAKSKKPRGANGGIGGDDGYEVGYGKPPKAGQFKKGQSGNPGGRKKGSPNLKTVYARVYGEPMELVINNKKRLVDGKEAMVWREFQLAMAGDGRVINQALNRIERFDAAEHSMGPAETSEDDRAIIDHALRRESSAAENVSSDQTGSRPDDDGFDDEGDDNV